MNNPKTHDALFNGTLWRFRTLTTADVRNERIDGRYPFIPDIRCCDLTEEE